MNVEQRQTIGPFDLEVTSMGFGGAPFGNLFQPIPEEEAIGALHAAHAAGIRYFDTAALYGYGLSESRYGAGLSDFNRDEIVISTKVGYTLVPLEADAPADEFFVEAPRMKTEFDYSRDAVLRSLEGSLERLKTDRVDIVYIHDPDEGVTLFKPGSDPYEASHFREVMEMTYPALDELRSQKVIGAIGLGMNQWEMLADFAVEGEFDCFLLAGRYTLLEQESLEKLLPLCEQRNIRIVIGGPYNSGILATGATAGSYYNYQTPPPQVLEKVSRIEAVCARHDVPLPAAALQFPFGHPTVASVIPGSRNVTELESNVQLFQHNIPAAFWAELKSESLVHADAPLPA
jgi:D-threo-aldose 1-dehydrogenase